MALTTFVAGNVLTAAQLNDSFAAVGGLRAVVPSSVTVTGAGSSATVGTNGQITITSAESFSINGAFSSAFRNYLMVADLDASGSPAFMDVRLRVGGADNTTANAYTTQQSLANTTTLQTLRSASTLFGLGPISNVGTNGWQMTFFRPFLADTTSILSNLASSLSNAYNVWASGYHNQNTSYDGFTALISTGNMTGTVTIYGLFG